jgi:hypothetical protein
MFVLKLGLVQYTEKVFSTISLSTFDRFLIYPYNKAMREWSLGPDSPLYLIIAADARLCEPNYVNDHIWELEFGSGEPAALSLRTTFGLRARAVRIYPRFTESGKAITDPAEFASPPVVRRFFSNYLEISFSPFSGLEVIYEIRQPESDVIAGRVTVVNHTTAIRNMNLEMCAGLVPLDGNAFSNTQTQMVNVLVGQTGDLVPLLFMTGGPLPGAGPLPALMIEMELGPGATRQLTWVQAAKGERQSSFDAARLVAAQPWEAERTRIEMVNAGQMIEIYTTDPEWDAALAFSQSAAFSLFFPANNHLPHASFVTVRGPDQGFSHKGDGSDYPASWAGQTPLETYYLASLLPAAPDYIQGVLRNFVAIQKQDGKIDGKPGLAGQRGRSQAMPLLASLAWNLFEISQDENFLADIFPNLSLFYWAWFSPQNDRDRDGVPEWGHLLQTGYEENPLFDTWDPGSQGADISFVSNPALLSFLFREANSLIKIAERLHRQNEVKLLNQQVASLKSELDESWNPRTALYRYRDRETGLTAVGKVLARQRGPGKIKLKRTFEQPLRLLIEVQAERQGARRPHVIISEYVTKGQSEVIPGTQFQWRSGGMVATSQKVHKKIGRIEVKGVQAKDLIIVRSLDYTSEDHTLLLPLWAGVPDVQQAHSMLARAVLNAERFDRPFGIPSCLNTADPESEANYLSVYLLWNQLFGEGMLEYGFRVEAARLVAHLMSAVIQNLKQNRTFYQYYHSETGQGMGERNALSGLAPVGLFLRVLGLQVLSATQVRLEGLNPFPWPVTVQYKGLKVVRGLDKTEIVFPNGKKFMVTDPTPCTVSLQD